MNALRLASALLLACAALPARADSIDCGSAHVSVGDSKVDLLGKCGEPSMREERAQSDASFTATGPNNAAQAGEAKRVTQTVERWTYNFGPQRFVQYVTLTNGRVTAIVSGNYGSVQAQASEKPVRGAVPVARCDALRAFNEGDHTFDILTRCGEPASREFKQVDRTQSATAPDGTVVTGESHSSDIETWTYNFGPSAFLRRLVFRDGVLVRIETGGYGY